MNYDIHFTDTALSNLSKYPQKDQQLTLKQIERLAIEPTTKSNVKKLVNFGIAYRMRVGHYRILFERQDNIGNLEILI
jgi:mRNA interferase RelE/StbE